MALKLFPYEMTSESAKSLANILGILRIKKEGTYVPKHYDKVLNWGNSRIPSWSAKAVARGVTVLNKPEAVNIASNKLLALQALQRAGIRTPEFTTSMQTAQHWLTNRNTVVERHELRGNSGIGIRIVNLDDQEMAQNITAAPLYTKFIPKTSEFRVHVFNGQVIDYIEKKKLSTDRRPTNFNRYISSLEYGWVFSRTDIRDMTEVRQLAIKAVAALGLDFGAVDIVYCDGLPYVLEVNTAPGLAGTTLVRYANALRRFMGQPDLDATTTASLMDRTTARVAAVTAQVDTNLADLVTLRIDRGTAIKLRNLLMAI